jgi:hypothetical protein
MYADAPLIAFDPAHCFQHCKFNDEPRLYVAQQQHTVQIIQLVEGPPPPPRNLASAFDESSSHVSSSAFSEDWDDDDDAQEEEQEEEVCESYCSSEEQEAARDQPTSTSDTYSLRMKRILAWRENFSAHLSAMLSGGLHLCFVVFNDD